ncbi:hypothetical protein [Colwellia sp. Bg11-28]|uniref:hypothetical protein n=1 Tax=Colwellia sp. Bg11-28 TaxID=2058305 RepID=UPI000C324D68|nr:hypothetical protein [Colwellia sp. Bg11-28]PKH85503.1 hypothetical protein CXF79_19780 [Colwellia sp. Bg11-28]
MNNHEFRQIIHSLFNLTDTQKRELLDAVKAKLNRTQTESMIENIKGEVICFPHCVSTAIFRWEHWLFTAQTEARSNEGSDKTEADEMFFSISFGGAQNIFKYIPRKRSKQDEKYSDKDKKKSRTVKERSDKTANYLLGKHNNDALIEKLEQIVNTYLILCTDGAHACKNLLKKHDIIHHLLIDFHCVSSYFGWRRFLESGVSKTIKTDALSIVFNNGLIQIFQSYNIERYRAALKGI